MTESDPLRKYVEAGLALTQLTRARAEAIVKDLVKAGELHREQAQDRVEELLDRSRKGTEGLVGLIRKEISRQLSSIGFATKEDLESLEARLEGRLAAVVPDEAPKPKPPRKPPTRGAAKVTTAPSSGAARKAGPRATAPPGSAARTAGSPKARRRSGELPDEPPDKA